MSVFHNNKSVMRIVSGLLFAGAVLLSFSVFRSSELFSRLFDSDPETELIPKAQEILAGRGHDPEDFSYTVDRSIAENLLEYVQEEQLGFDDASALPYFRDIVRASFKDGESGGSIQLDFGPDGSLFTLIDTLTESDPGSEPLSDQTAESLAREFIRRFAAVDSARLVTREGSSNEVDGITEYIYTIEYISSVPDSLDESFAVSVSGDIVTNYRRSVTIRERNNPGFVAVSGIVLRILNVLIILAGIIFVIVFFLKKLKRDELEYRKGIWAGSICLLFFIGNAASTSFESFGLSFVIEFILPAFFGGIFLWGVITIAFAVGESLTRDVWRNKLQGIDTIFHGKILVREIGDFIMKGMGIAGLLLILYVLSKAIAEEYFGSWLVLFMEEGLHSSLITASLNILLDNAVDLVLFFVSFVLVWGSVLKKGIKNERLFVVLVAVVLAAAVYTQLMIKPSYVAFASFAPVCMVWAVFYRKEDFVTVLVASSVGLILIRMEEIMMLSSSSIPIAGAVYGSLAVFYIFGYYLSKKGVSFSDVALYVPEYVIRLEEKDRIMKELEIAREVQKKFLPAETPKYRHAEIEAICQPAQEVGGDYFDFFQYDDDRIGMIIGDVSGKGVHAAFYMTMVKGIIKTLTREYTSPREILCNLNRIFYENAPNNVFISAIYGVFDFNTGQLSYARAGHLPLMVWRRKDNTISHDVPTGMAIGLDSGELFEKNLEEATCQLGEGDLYLFFTDGISEANNSSGEEFGEERLEKLIVRFAESGPKTILDEIRNSVMRFSGKTRRRDDITAIAVKIKDTFNKSG